MTAAIQVQEDKSGGKATGFHFAPHRFDSVQKPMARFILHLDALLSVAQRIVRDRKGEVEGKASGAFLAFMSNEVVLQIAMIADAGDEGATLMRFLDVEGLDTARMPHDINRFLTHVTNLFCDRSCLRLPGYTKHALELLRRTRLLDAGGGKVNSLGAKAGPAPDVVNRCIKEMQSWVTMARKVCDAEFPSFDVLMSFSVFDVSSQITEGAHHGVARQYSKDHFHRLATVFGVTADDLEREHAHHLPLAQQACKDDPSLSNLGAWQRALKLTQYRESMRIVHPAKTLKHVLYRRVVVQALFTSS